MAETGAETIKRLQREATAPLAAFETVETVDGNSFVRAISEKPINGRNVWRAEYKPHTCKSGWKAWRVVRNKNGQQIGYTTAQHALDAALYERKISS